MSKQEYIDRADAICTRLDRAYDQILHSMGGSEEKDIADALQQRLPLVRDALTDLRALQPPSELAARVDAWMRLNETADDDVEDLIDAWNQGDESKLDAANARYESNEKRADALAADVGLRVCADDGLRG